MRWHGKRRDRALPRAPLLGGQGRRTPRASSPTSTTPRTEYLRAALPRPRLLQRLPRGRSATFESYLARLQNLAGDRPLLITEIGLDSRRNGEEAQARGARLAGPARLRAPARAGIFVFSWTDEWHRGGHEVDDWDFGLVDRERAAEAGAGGGRRAPSPTLPFRPDRPLAAGLGGRLHPQRRSARCASASTDLRALELPRLRGDRRRRRLHATAPPRSPCEHGVAPDQHRAPRPQRAPATPGIAGGDRARSSPTSTTTPIPDPRLAPLPGRTASRATATPASAARTSRPPTTAAIAECVATAPGGPIHVLLSDREAEHIPGCNMAFRKQRAGGDRRLRRAVPRRRRRRRRLLAPAGGGLDARLQRRARSSGTTAATRSRGYLKQQYGYGKAEALLERKWPERYNRAGHLAWAGRIYGNSLDAQPRAAALEDLLRHLGQRPLPVGLRAGAGRARAPCR